MYNELLIQVPCGHVSKACEGFQHGAKAHVQFCLIAFFFLIMNCVFAATNVTF